MSDAEFQFGPLVGPGATEFRLWAPGIEAVALEVEGHAPVRMMPTGDGWYRVDAPVGPGALYRFRLPDGTRVPDPASRAQPGDVHGPSLVVDPNAYHWRCADWRGRPWEETILYELHVGLLGRYKGVLAHLPRLAELGITAIELMPVAEFPGARNWGYDGVLPFAPESSYGTPEDLKMLVDEAHSLGLMVLLDVVYNHFGPDGNWMPSFAPGFFRDDLHTPWGAAIDFRRKEVRRFFIENALYWLGDFRFDGLRLDAVHAISEPDWIGEMADEVRGAFPGRDIHLVLENEGNVAEHLLGRIDAQWNDDFHNVMHVLLTGETEAYYEDFADRPADKLARALAQGFVYQGEPSKHHGGKPRGSKSADLPPTAFVNFLQNHDQIGNRALGERLTMLADPDALCAATALLLLCPQIPLIFMGDETGAVTPFLFFTDFHGDLADAVRDGRRKEFAKFPAFSDPTQRENIPDPNALSTFDGSTLDLTHPQADGWRALYRDLLALRHRHIIPSLKGARSIGAAVLGEKAVAARWRLGGEILTLVCNLGDRPVRIEAPSTAPIWGSLADGVVSPKSTIAWMSAT
ncbi:MAG: treZ [Rhodospirillales bacterium]|nr:treZ [Rhodospirillales bacterium]